MGYRRAPPCRPSSRFPSATGAQSLNPTSTVAPFILVAFGRGQMVVVDRAMAFDENLEQLRARGLRYLVASRHSERSRWLAEFENLEGFDEVIRMPSPSGQSSIKFGDVWRLTSSCACWPVTCWWRSRRCSSTRACIPPGRACAMHWRLMPSSRSCCRRIPARRCVSARPPRPSPSTANSTDCLASTRKSCRRRRSGVKQATRIVTKKSLSH